MNHIPALAFLTGVFLASNAHAQVVPSTADPIKASDRFREQPILDRTSPLERQETTPQTPSPESTFVLGGVSISGLTVFSPTQFKHVYEDSLGKPITIAQAREIASKITAHYHQSGYGLATSYVPEQIVDDGSILRIQVDEGRIGKVRFEGEKPPASIQNLVTRLVDKISKQKPVKTESLEHYLLLVNDLPGNTARALLRPSAEQPGTTDLIVYYDHQPIEATLTTDNRGSDFLGPWQHSASISANSTFGFDERVTLRTITTSPAKELGYIDMQYEQPVGTQGTKVITTASFAKTNPGERLKALNVQSKTTDVNMRVIHPLLRSRLENLYVRGTFDVRNSVTDLAHANLIDDRVRSVRVGVSYDTANKSSASLVDAEISRGIDGLGATEDGTGRSNPAAKHDYTKVTLDASHNQLLPHNFSLLVTGSGHYAFNTLLSPEQYLLGGPLFGTAYDPGELSGDHGVAGKLELRREEAIDGPLIKSAQLYGFYDIGTIWRRDPIGSEKSKSSLSSAGAGVRLDMHKSISANLEVALPLTREAGTEKKGDTRIYGGVAVQY
ncbi:MAG: ShlB/FhaC/HecB family hemolysin secretion/activation protein [Rickettsiales bacterium]